jgi:hypothetical protein
MWIVYPRLRTVHIIRPSEPRHILGADDTLDAPDVLPGFSLAISALFV